MFKYKALMNGKIKTYYSSAITTEEFNEECEEKGHDPIFVKQIKDKTIRFTTFNLNDKVEIFSILSGYAGTKLTKSEIIGKLSTSFKKKKQLSALKEMEAIAELRTKMWIAFSSDSSFSTVDIAILKLSENTGNLKEGCKSLYEYTVGKSENKNTIKNLLYLPVVGLLMIAIMFIFFSYKLIPSLDGMTDTSKLSPVQIFFRNIMIYISNQPVINTALTFLAGLVILYLLKDKIGKILLKLIKRIKTINDTIKTENNLDYLALYKILTLTKLTDTSKLRMIANNTEGDFSKEILKMSDVIDTGSSLSWEEIYNQKYFLPITITKLTSYINTGDNSNLEELEEILKNKREEQLRSITRFINISSLVVLGALIALFFYILLLPMYSGLKY